MKLIRDINIGDIIKGKSLNRRVTGKVVKKHPGAVVIEITNRVGDKELVVVNMDLIFKIVKKVKQ